MSEEKAISEKVEYIENIAEDKIAIDHAQDSDNDTTTFIKSEAEKKLVRKINYTMMPLMFFVIVFQFVDRASLSVAAVMGIIQDTNMTLTQFSWAGSIFCLGYLLCQISNYYLIQKFRPAKYLGVAIILWGISVSASSSCTSFTQLAVCRFFLGLFEGTTYPCVYIILNSLYRRSEQSLVWGFLGAATGFGTVIGIGLAFIYMEMIEINGWNSWRWGYLINGLITVIIGIFTFFFMADDPYHPLFKLTEEEKLIVAERVKDNCVIRVREIKTYQIWEAVKEWRFYLILLIYAVNELQNGGVVTYSTLLVGSLGFGMRESILLQIPNGMIAAFFSLMAVSLAHRTKKVTLIGVTSASLACLGFILMITVPGKPKLVGFYFSWAMLGTMAMVQTLVTTNVSGYTKKVFYNNAIMVATTVGSFGGPLMMVESQAPEYKKTMIAFAFTNVVSVIGFLCLFFIMSKENKKRLADHVDPVDVNLDLTDKENKGFIYKL